MQYDIREARIRAAHKVPYYRSWIYSMPIVEAPGLGTCACDQYGRLYVDPEMLSQWTLEEMASVVLHEVDHALGRHHERAKPLMGAHPSKKQMEDWNVATDCIINSRLRDMKLPLPEGCCYPENQNLPTDYQKHCCEDYYRILEERPSNSDGGSGFDPGCFPGGSGGDGVPRNHEQGPPSDECPGLDKDAQDRLERQVAQDIQEANRDKPGSVPGHMQKWADTIMKPRFDPKRELKAQCRGVMSTKPGVGFQTYQRPNRRPMGEARLPVQRMPAINVAVCIDTSGSMGNTDTGLALGVFGECCSHVPPENLVVYTGDTHAASCQKVFRPEQVNLVGGGGTDMGAMIEHAVAQKPKPDVILVATDGHTPWCEPVKAKVVAAMTRKDQKAPDWIRSVYIGREE